jgi:hypothetical protein
MSRDGFTEIILYILSEAWMRKELSSEAVDMNGRFQMQGGKNLILPK